MALHDFTMQQWWMESLTAKIIAFSLELPEFYVFFFSFFKRLSIERCQMHHHADRPSLKVAVSFHSKNFVQKIRLKSRETHGWTWPKRTHSWGIYFSVGRIDVWSFECGNVHLFLGSNLKIRQMYLTDPPIGGVISDFKSKTASLIVYTIWSLVYRQIKIRKMQ